MKKNQLFFKMIQNTLFVIGLWLIANNCQSHWTIRLQLITQPCYPANEPSKSATGPSTYWPQLPNCLSSPNRRKQLAHFERLSRLDWGAACGRPTWPPCHQHSHSRARPARTPCCRCVFAPEMGNCYFIKKSITNYITDCFYTK